MLVFAVRLVDVVPEAKDCAGDGVGAVMVTVGACALR